MGLKMAEFEAYPVPDYFSKPEFEPESVSTPAPAPAQDDPPFLPYWARSRVQCAQNLLACSDEPIEYDHDDEDYRDNCFFFPEDCSWTPPKDWVVEAHCLPTREIPKIRVDAAIDPQDKSTPTPTPDTMIPGLPDIKMLDAEALGDLLEDNLSPPEITTILVFSTNGAVFAYASPFPSRHLRNLSATYGAAYTCYAKTASTGNLTGVNPASHPSSYVTAQSNSLGDVGSIVFELDNSVAVVTRIADKVLLAAVGPSKLDGQNPPQTHAHTADGADGENVPVDGDTSPPAAGERGGDGQQTPVVTATATPPGNGSLDAQGEIDRSADLARLAGLNLSASPAVLLALESKCAALGRFLGQKLDDLESPEEF